MKARLAAVLDLQISLMAFKCAHTLRKYRLVLLHQLVHFASMTSSGVLLSLRGSLPKSGPLDFATKNSYPLFFVGEEALVGIYYNRYFCFQILILISANELSPSRPLRECFKD